MTLPSKSIPMANKQRAIQLLMSTHWTLEAVKKNIPANVSVDMSLLIVVTKYTGDLVSSTTARSVSGRSSPRSTANLIETRARGLSILHDEHD